MISQNIGKIKFRRGKDSEARQIIFDESEMIYFTDKSRLMIGDGTTLGGISISNRAYITDFEGIPSHATYGDIIYCTTTVMTYIVGLDTDKITLKLYEICNYGKYLSLKERLNQLYSYLRPLSAASLDPYLDKAPPVILTHPESLNIETTTRAYFSISVSGSEPITYQWYKNDIPIAGAVGFSYVINNTNFSDAGNYKCKASNSYGVVISNSANLLIVNGIAPNIVTQPNSLTLNNGLNASFTLSATGTPTLYYQWYKNNNIILGATSNTYNITNINSVDSGNYKCVITNSFGVINSKIVTLQVNTGSSPVITSNPTSININNGLNATFNVVATGTAPLTYQWYKNNVVISGANNSSYTLTNVDASSVGSFKCTVTNSFGSATSNIANLTVNIGTTPTITTQPIAQTVVIGSTTTFNIIAIGTAPLTYQWYKNGSTLISGATLNTYNITNTNSINEGTYKCIVTNSFGVATSDEVALKVNIGIAPSIKTQPIVNYKVLTTGEIQVNIPILATGTPILAYQWYKDNIIISGATSSTYTINNATKSDEGGYKCIVTNIYGNIESKIAVLSLGLIGVSPTITAQPIAQTFIDDKPPVTYSVTATGTPPLTYQWYDDGAVILGATNSTFSVTQTNILPNHKLKCKVTNDYGSVISNEVTHSRVCKLSFNLTAGTEHITYVDSSGKLLYNKTTVSPSELPYEIDKGYLFELYSGSATGGCSAPDAAYLYKNDTLIKAYPSGTQNISISEYHADWKEVVGKYKAVFTNASNSITGSQLEVSNITTGTAPKITVQPVAQTIIIGNKLVLSVTTTGTTPVKYQWRKDGSNISGATSNTYTINSCVMSDAGKYTCFVYNLFGSVLSNQANITMLAGYPPTIKTQPTFQISKPTFYYPSGITIDSSGNLYVCERTNNTIRKITPAGVVTTIAGTAGQSGSTDGTGSAARFYSPEGITIDSSGNLYVCEYWNHTIRKITPSGVVTTIAGTAGKSGWTDATGSAAEFFYPSGITIDPLGNLYVAQVHVIRKITPSGVVTTFAGHGSGWADGIGVAAKFFNPRGVTTDPSGNLYVCERNNNTIRKITSTGVVTTLAGLGKDNSYIGNETSGSADGTGSAANFSYPSGITIDSSGNLYVCDTNNNTIRKITPAGVVTTFAGTAGQSGRDDGTGSAARFYRPEGITIDSSNNLYVCDTSNNTIRKITPSGVVTTIAGDLTSGHNDDLIVMFSVASYNGLSYQWYYNNTLISGATSSDYIISKPNNGAYKCIVKNNFGSVESDTVNLTL